jgi:tRNA pseudouridine38-40 synthase
VSVVLRVAYDGTEYAGFARQPGVRTVQGAIESALLSLYKVEVLTRAASRTDAGVHARGQIVAYEPPFAIPDRGLVLGLSSELPRDVAVSAAWLATAGDGGPFQPRFENAGKHYAYRIRCARVRDPLADRFEWHLARGLDVEAMRLGARGFLGEHDFTAFRAADCQARTTVRHVEAVEIETGVEACVPSDPRIDRDGVPTHVTVHVHGRAFLKNMVRIMVGTLVEVGLGRRQPQEIETLLSSSGDDSPRRDRRDAGPTAPARGLTLEEVKLQGRTTPSR